MPPNNSGLSDQNFGLANNSGLVGGNQTMAHSNFGPVNGVNETNSDQVQNSLNQVRVSSISNLCQIKNGNLQIDNGFSAGTLSNSNLPQAQQQNLMQQQNQIMQQQQNQNFQQQNN